VTSLSRRRFLLSSVAAPLVLAACGNGTTNQPEANTDRNLSFLVPAFPDGFSQAATLVAGIEQRLPFVVRDQLDVMRDDAPERLAVAVRSNGRMVQQFTLDAHSDGIITPYFPLRMTFSTPGQYEAALPDHPDVPPVPFLVADRSSVAIPQVGSQLPVVATPTVADPQGVNPICTRALPCSLHRHDLAEVATNQRPTVLLIATPGFCQTDICGPVVDLLLEVAGDRTDLDLIHAEVYMDPTVFATGAFPDLTPVVAALDLPYEPALFVLDGAGTVTARLDTTFDRSELAAALELVS